MRAVGVVPADGDGAGEAAADGVAAGDGDADGSGDAEASGVAPGLGEIGLLANGDGVAEPATARAVESGSAVEPAPGLVAPDRGAATTSPERTPVRSSRGAVTPGPGATSGEGYWPASVPGRAALVCAVLGPLTEPAPGRPDLFARVLLGLPVSGAFSATNAPAATRAAASTLPATRDPSRGPRGDTPITGTAAGFGASGSR